MQSILTQGNRGPDGRSGAAGPIGKRVNYDSLYIKKTNDHSLYWAVTGYFLALMSSPLVAGSIGSYWTEGPCWRTGSFGKLSQFCTMHFYRPGTFLGTVWHNNVLSLPGLTRTSWARGCRRKAWYTGSHSLSYFNPIIVIWSSYILCVISFLRLLSLNFTSILIFIFIKRV